MVQHATARVRAWDFLVYVREVGGSNPGCGTTVGGIFHPTRQMARFSPPNMSSIVNPRGETVNYRQYASPSFEVAKPRKITAISAIIIISIIINRERYQNNSKSRLMNRASNYLFQ